MTFHRVAPFEVDVEVDEESADGGLVKVALLSPSRGSKIGDLLEVTDARASELVRAGLARRL